MPHSELQWSAILNRDASWEGRLIYAVRTTGVYCRPTCPSRRPKRENVSFYETPADAAAAGFRACQRCHPDERHASRAAASVERARQYLDRQVDRFPDQRITLDELAQAVGMSPHHLQRTFKRLTGASPAQYTRARRSERLRQELRRGETVSRATYGAGYGSSRGAYEAADAHLGMTPATYRRGGLGSHIRYVVVPSAFGRLLVGATDRGVCAVKLGDDDRTLETALASEYPKAERERLRRADAGFGAWVAAIVRHLEGADGHLQVPTDVRGTAFQWRVWRALQEIPYGETRSYGEIAAAIGSPRAVRAVAGACADNHVAIVIPCHRVVRRGGALGGYRWGIERKRRLLDQESRLSKPTTPRIAAARRARATAAV